MSSSWAGNAITRIKRLALYSSQLPITVQSIVGSMCLHHQRTSMECWVFAVSLNCRSCCIEEPNESHDFNPPPERAKSVMQHMYKYRMSTCVECSYLDCDWWQWHLYCKQVWWLQQSAYGSVTTSTTLAEEDISHADARTKQFYAEQFLVSEICNNSSPHSWHRGTRQDVQLNRC